MTTRKNATQARCRYCGLEVRWFRIYHLAHPVFGKKEEVVVCSSIKEPNECQKSAEREGYTKP